jgi:hypothetical protein
MGVSMKIFYYLNSCFSVRYVCLVISSVLIGACSTESVNLLTKQVLNKNNQDVLIKIEPNSPMPNGFSISCDPWTCFPKVTSNQIHPSSRIGEAIVLAAEDLNSRCERTYRRRTLFGKFDKNSMTYTVQCESIFGNLFDRVAIRIIVDKPVLYPDCCSL